MCVYAVTLLSFIYLLSSYLVAAQWSDAFAVRSIDHSSWFSQGKYFNFWSAEIDAILGRKDWDNEVFRVMIEREDEMLTVDVRLFRDSNGGSIGDAHGRKESNAARSDWRMGDMIQFYESDDWRIYDHSIGDEAFYYAMSAYCGSEKINKWSHGLVQGPKSTKKFEIFRVINNEEKSLQSFIGFDNANSRIVLSFRGSANKDNWFDTNFDILSVEYPNARSGVDAKIHPGFYDGFKELEAGGLTDALREAFQQRPEFKNVFITGHSLGGALAAVAAIELKQSPIYKSLPIGRVDVVTFGSPRWCNKELAALYNEVIDSNWRIVNRYDTVAAIPIKKMGYYHVGTEIWYNFERWSWNERPLAYKICDGSGEDPDCFGTDYWPSRVDHTLFNDHTSYFAINQDGLCGEDEIDDEVELSHDVDDNKQNMDNDFESWPNDWVDQVTKRLAMDGKRRMMGKRLLDLHA